MKKFLAALPYIAIGAALMIGIGFIVSKIREKKSEPASAPKGV